MVRALKHFSILPFLFTDVAAYYQISVPASISTDKDFVGTFVRGASDNIAPNTTTHYSVFLASYPDTSDFVSAICLLANNTPVATTSLDLRIPANVGRAGRYVVTSFQWDEKKLKEIGWGLEGVFNLSDPFTLVGATESWSKAEMDGRRLGTGWDVPCESYDCARKCNEFYYSNYTLPAYKATWECLSKCEGVATPLDWSTKDEDLMPYGFGYPISESNHPAIATATASTIEALETTQGDGVSTVTLSTAGETMSVGSTVAATIPTPTGISEGGNPVVLSLWTLLAPGLVAILSLQVV